MSAPPGARGADPGPAARPARRALGLILLAATLAACAATPGPLPVGPAPALAERVRSELVFGRSRPDGSVVTETEWQAFLAEHVTPRFPDGLTVLDATGQYRDRAGRLVREPSKVLILVHPAEPAALAAVEEVRARYRGLFDQESVLLIRSRAGVGF
jgi:hypothetical protein